MSIFEHSRFEIWNAAQHPYKHSLSDFQYSNPAFGDDVVNLEQALDYVLAVLYPQSMPAVDEVADLPTVGNTLNDMRVVNDDGDGKAASYRWERREGEASPSWHKIYDVDWGTDSILQAWGLKTQDVYVSKYGYDDRDGSGVIVAGVLAGQKIFGGATAGSHLTLFANSGDGVGVGTGYVQFGDNARPTADNSYDLGTAALKFKSAYLAGSLFLGTMTLASGSITDSSGAIDFGNENLTTTGDVTAADVTGLTLTATDGLEDMLITYGSITSSMGFVDFIDNDLVTTGGVTADDGFQAGTLLLTPGSITDSSGAIDFGNENLTTTGTVSAATATATTVNGGNLRLAANVLSSTDTDGNIALTPNGVGTITFSAAAAGVSLGLSGALTAATVDAATSVDGGNLRLAANTLSSTDVNGNIVLDPNGVGLVEFGALLRPTTDTTDLGDATHRVGTLYTATAISDGSNSIAMATLLSLRDILSGVGSGMTIFYDGSKWVASAPDTEVDHGTISGLSDDDHAQYALLAGRSGGQTLKGSTLASEHLTLDSTNHATKGFIKFSSSAVPTTTAAYSAGWTGTDLGGASNKFNNVYTAGEFLGLRLENLSSAPSPSVQKVGRLYYDTTLNQVWADNGTAVHRVGNANRYEEDISWSGADVTKNATVTTANMDARKAIWVLRDNSNNYAPIQGASITATSTTAVTITVGIALPAGTYRLIGLE